MIADGGASGGPGWVVAVNLVIWTGIFLYLLRLEGRFHRKDGDE
ncbi:MAG: CcmD family protein [Thermoanaerobaculia bacterium]